MPNTLSRRSFIKAGLLTAGAAAIAGVPHPANAAETELCTVLDLSKCIACGACVEACREVNEAKFPNPEGPMPDMIPRNKVKIADWSSPEKREVDDRLTPYNWLFIRFFKGQGQWHYAGNGVMYKCDRCYNRLEEGELPACIDVCPENVQEIGPRPEMVARAHQLATEMDGFIYGETENGGTNTIYVSPVPFDVLNQAIDKDPGSPHLEPASDVMASPNNMALAVAIAPVAGVAGAVARFLSLGKDGNGKET